MESLIELLGTLHQKLSKIYSEPKHRYTQADHPNRFEAISRLNILIKEIKEFLSSSSSFNDDLKSRQIK